MSYAKQLREKQARLATQMRAIVDTAKKEDRGLNTEERTSWANMMAQYETNEASINAEEKLVLIETGLGKVAEDDLLPALADAGRDPVTGGRRTVKADNSPHAKAFGK